ncbi:hypothetical protein C5167_027027 [Papaver somniferum]|uniref:uncharacterized protein LOC113336177 n=1 Tax=Papaver somniferum TaxID=3469 RepID=UPI000E6FF4DD|nr:uncharacterized protein LOC113336177 [Papaver somniferum]RZC89487.1 hypothetical protein C5167_027027 [Papaver somniferum]
MMSFKKLFLHYFVFILISSIFISSTFSSQTSLQIQRKQSIGGTRKLFSVEETEDEVIQKPKKKKNIKQDDEDTPILKPKKNPTKGDDQEEIQKPKKKLIKEDDEEIQVPKPKKKPIKQDDDDDEEIQILKPKKKTSNKNTTISISLPKTVLVKKLNSTKSSSPSTKKSQQLSKEVSTSKNKTPELLKSKNPELKTKTLKENKIQTENKPKKPITPIWMLEDDTTDFISEFTDLPSRFQETLIPDLERMSTKSKAYINRANREITEGYIKPYIGKTNAKKYASQIASIISAISILVPLILVSLIFNKIKTYFSLQKIIIFIQIYLSIYFSILSLSALITGLEPLKFFFASSQSRYICLQILQTLGYVLYLLLLLMYLVLVFSTETGLSTKVLGLGQTIVGFAVGLHYYVTVFHRAVLNQSPKSNWKINGVYAVCFLVICVFAGAERRKKAYLEDGGDEGKKS